MENRGLFFYKSKMVNKIKLFTMEYTTIENNFKIIEI